MLKRIVLILLLLSLLKTLNAQFYSTGEEAFSVRWNQIRTPHFKIIFPEKYDSIAQKLSLQLEYYYEYAQQGLQFKKDKIPVLLHAKSITSNGMVVWTPRRMELYLHPPQDNYPQPWLDQLAIHELRHVMQMNALNNSWQKPLSWFFGEISTGAFAAMTPLWLLEGDAVFQESIWSKSGRGKLAEFDRSLKAWLYAYPFHYDQLLSGSYKTETPNHYQYGFYTRLYGEIKYGSEFWNQQFKHIANHPWQIVPSYFGIKKQTGQSRKAFISAALNHYKQKWETYDSLIKPFPYKPLLKRKKQFETYRALSFFNDSILIAEKYSKSSTPEFVQININQLKETRISKHGYLSSERLSASNHRFAWAEKAYHPRWAHASKNQILYRRQGEVKRILTAYSLEAPALSKNGNFLCAVENRNSAQSVLHVYDLELNAFVKSFTFPSGTFIQFPSWKNKEEVVYTFLNEAGKGIEKINVRNGKRKIIIEASHYQIQKPKFQQDTLYFIADYNGTDNIYRFFNGTKKQLTNVVFGVGDYSIQNNQLVFTNYSATGFYPSLIHFSEIPKIEIFYKHKKYEDINAFSIQKLLDFKDSSSTLEVKPYRKWKYLFHIHSWVPAYFDIQEVQQGNYSIHPGITFYSQNTLSTSFLTAAYEYDMEHIFHLNYEYKGFFPVIGFGIDYGETPQSIIEENYTSSPSLHKNLNFNAEMRIPLSFYHSWTTLVQPSLKVSYSGLNYMPYGDSTYTSGLGILDGRFQFSRYQRTSLQQIYPKWGISFEVRAQKPLNNESFARMFYAYNRVFLPGLFHNHSLRLSGGYFSQSSNKFYYYSFIPVVRGLDRRSYFPVEATSFSLDYTFPIAYPDWNLGSILYIKRFYSNLFGDLAKHKIRRPNYQTQQIDIIQETYYSYGLELSMDFRPFRFLYDVNIGLQTAYIPQKKAFNYELLFAVDF